ncbi:kinesin-like protein KIF28P isoform X2 [Patiria miniata]|uniref:Kinesin-like protein 6 n=1 Tax=Patiria miniata TaxID=46514 RepID=A0A914BEQ7_PATMI|nr:kinesin-like protein KIF28P isoform X2 [Patiria miniata]
MPDDSVKVAVRVRPFNQRELAANSKCVVSMEGNVTSLTNPDNGKVHTFAYDYSYWSHDGFQENEEGLNTPTNDRYADQTVVFNDLGRGVLDNAWQGYNAALFAYGQTGSGKSYSMIGYGANKGIVPITCNELFKAINSNTDTTKQLQVSFSMLEIYNEQVRDLLVKPTKGAFHALKVRQNPQTGFYVDGLKTVPVRDYKQIEHLTDQGTLNRTTASTNMNATSSRSHMVITLKFKQVYNNENGENTTMSSEINLVDLAGSERAKATGATGDRLKEGSAINQSLSMLGNVISALADQSMGKNVRVPYRDSVLTKLLQNALGGNSKTIMIAALSPAGINFEETLSTLRYADRAKKIKNKAVVNESPTERLIRELREENAKLLNMMKSGRNVGSSDADVESLYKENERQMQEMDQTWEHRLLEAREEWEKSQRLDRQESSDYEHHPYIQNVNEDPHLSGIIKHVLLEGTTVVGKGLVDGNDKHRIDLAGLGIHPEHAYVSNSKHKMTLTAVGDSRILVNGKLITKATKLHHQDRVIFGTNSLFLYIGFTNQRSAAEDSKGKYNYHYFQAELAESQGFGDRGMLGLTMTGDNSAHDALMRLVYHDFTSLLPSVAEVNEISQEMNRGIRFEPLIKNLTSHDARGRDMTKEVAVRVTDTETNQVWIWSADTFVNRRFLIKDLYQKFLDSDGDLTVQQAADPFWDPVEDVLLGTCHVWLMSLAYLMGINDEFEVQNDQGKEEGSMSVKILPCDKKGKVLGDDSMTLDPSELLGKRLDLLVIIKQCRGVQWIREESRRGVYCMFDFFDCPTSFQTKTVWHNINTKFSFQKQFSIKTVTEEFLAYLQTNALLLQVWGTQASGDAEVRVDSLNDQPVGIRPNLSSSSLNSLSDASVSSSNDEEPLMGREFSDDLRKQAIFNQRQLKENERVKKTGKRLHHHHLQSVDLPGRLRAGSVPAYGAPQNSQARERSASHIVDTSNGPENSGTSVDGQIGKLLKTFFHDIKPVQVTMKAMQESYEQVDLNDLEAMRTHILQQQEQVTGLNKQLTTSLTSLRSHLSLIIRSKRQSRLTTDSQDQNGMGDQMQTQIAWGQ